MVTKNHSEESLGTSVTAGPEVAYFPCLLPSPTALIQDDGSKSRISPLMNMSRIITFMFSVLLYFKDFLPARRCDSACICYGISVCLCVYLYVTRVLCIKTAKRFVEIFYHLIVFRNRGSLLNSTPTALPLTGHRIQGVRKLGDF